MCGEMYMGVWRMDVNNDLVKRMKWQHGKMEKWLDGEKLRASTAH